MSDLWDELVEILRRAALRLWAAGMPVELAERVEKLSKQVYQPCVVAVVGRVKVGKSTFVNALLGEDLEGRHHRDNGDHQLLYLRESRPRPSRSLSLARW